MQVVILPLFHFFFNDKRDQNERIPLPLSTHFLLQKKKKSGCKKLIIFHKKHGTSQNEKTKRTKYEFKRTSKKCKKMLVGARCTRRVQGFHVVTPPPAGQQDELGKISLTGGATSPIRSMQPSLRTLRLHRPSLSSAPFAPDIAPSARSRRRSPSTSRVTAVVLYVKKKETRKTTSSCRVVACR